MPRHEDYLFEITALFIKSIYNTAFQNLPLAQAGANSLTSMETLLPASLETLVLMGNELTSLWGASEALFR